jgi:RNA polymerase sigma-70 factor (ECF subfamily)
MANPITQRAERVRRVLAGEAGLSKDDFTYLYRGQLRRVFNYVRYRLDAREAEDVTADIFSRAWACRRSYDPAKGTPSAWLWAIARNAVTDRLRRRRPVCVQIASEPGDSSDSLGELTREEELRQVRAALLQLPPLDQEIIALRFGAGHTNRAIAALTGLSEANVAQRLRRALRKMRIHLQGDVPA